MSLQYILDGYNITKQIPAFTLKNLKDSRDTLSRLIEIYQPQGSLHNQVTIVFDGQAGVFSPAASSAVKVIFSQDESADDKIRKIIESSPAKKQIIVVTDDKELKFSIRALGANVLPVKEFLLKMKDISIKRRFTKPDSQSRKDEEAKVISKSLEYKITSEFEKIWLKPKK